MRQKDPELNSNWGTICTPLEMIVKDRETYLDNFPEFPIILRMLQ